MIRLPVSGASITLNPLTGAEDLLLLETEGVNEPRLVLTLLERLARPTEGDPPDWGELAVTDADALLLYVRQSIFGDEIQAESVCPQPACGAKIDVSLRVTDYLAHHAPVKPRTLEPADETGWLKWTGAPLTFRIPTLRDQIAAAQEADPVQALQQRCVRPYPLPVAQMRRAERALENLSPSLNGTLQSVCPECGIAQELPFLPRAFTLRELREQAAFLYTDVHLLASQYHWTEAEILALPRLRRLYYVELIRQERQNRVI